MRQRPSLTQHPRRFLDRVLVSILTSSLLAGLASAQPSLSKVYASQIEGSTQIQITYDLSSTINGSYTVSVEASVDGGVTYAPIVEATGAVGQSVATGTGKLVQWDANTSWPDQIWKTAKVRVSAIASHRFSLVPGGTFTMGNNFEKDVSMVPLHEVSLPSFSMAQQLTTLSEWQTVCDWAILHGYTDLKSVGKGKAANHPVQTVSWYEAVKWCNAKSEKEGLVPCYYTDDSQKTVYRTGDVDVANSQVKWSVSGYRLPTEAEWEYVARGGLVGKRFPWGNTISHTQANYYSSEIYSYDVSNTRGDNPAYADGTLPHTSPVDAFAPNNYGMYDPAGNVWQWCWDWYGNYSSEAQKEPHGPKSGSYRIFRGGGWRSPAEYCRVAFRYGGIPSAKDYYVGLRIASSSLQPALLSSSAAVAESAEFVVDTRPPSISSSPISVSVNEGIGAIFSVQVGSGRSPTYRWQRLPATGSTWGAPTGDSYHGTGTDTLTIDKTTAAMNGDRFRCIVSNGALPDATSDIATLTVLTPPSFVRHPVAQNVYAGSAVTFVATAEGNPAPTYRWQKDGVNLDGETASTLTIPVVSPAEAGSYRVIATNSAGATPSAAAKLTVTAAEPSITSHPENATTMLGTMVDFNITAKGIPAPTYQWYLNGEPVEGRTTDHFGAFKAEGYHNGYTFKCVVSNMLGSVESHSATLKVEMPTAPAILSEPADVIGKIGSSADFSVEATAIPLPTYQWYLNGDPVVGATRSNFGKFDIAGYHEGWQFHCVVTNTVGSVVSRSAILHVGEAAAPSVTLNPANLTVLIGEPVDFSAAFTGLPLPACQWLLNGTPAEGRTALNYGEFQAEGYHDGYTFACVATNSLGSATTRVATLHVQAPAAPTITAEPADVISRVGAEVGFTIEATGAPAPTFQWYLNGDPVNGATSPDYPAFRVENYHDGMSFYCVATNSYGSATSRVAKLHVAPPPTVLEQSTSTIAQQGASATISVTAQQATSYQWFRNGIPVTGATAADLTVNAVQSTDVGFYDCLISGLGGDALSAPVLLGLVLPDGSRTAGSIVTRPEWQNIQHPNGHTYDQYLLTGTAGTISADPGQIARVSFFDENESIVQVEMSGAGSLTVALQNSSGPTPPSFYLQPGVEYMKGRASVVLTGADATTHCSIYSVGPFTNPAVVRPDATYAGWAQVAAFGISSEDGHLGGLYHGNVSYASDMGLVGVFAPTVVSVGSLVSIHEISASESAVPYLFFGATGAIQAQVAGGTFRQDNADSITVSGLAKVRMTAGQDSSGNLVPEQQIQARLVDAFGEDVTDLLVESTVGQP